MAYGYAQQKFLAALVAPGNGRGLCQSNFPPPRLSGGVDEFSHRPPQPQLPKWDHPIIQSAPNQHVKNDIAARQSRVDNWLHGSAARLAEEDEWHGLKLLLMFGSEREGIRLTRAECQILWEILS